MSASDIDGFGPHLRRLRLAAGLTQEALAERAEVSPRAISDLERDPERTPRLDTVRLLATALGLDPTEQSGLLAAARPMPPSTPRADLAALPRPLTPLIGRASVETALIELLRAGETRLLTLTGPGGVGKTRLALDLAASVAADYADGALFVDLTPLRDPSLVIGAVANSLGLDERDSTQLAARLAAALRAKHKLLLLDNFEHLIDARADLLTLLAACSGLTALVTSRVPLRVRGEREYRIAPLEVPRAGADSAPATALFAERARAAGVELTVEDRPVVAEICRRLEGLPLAIELAAPRVRLLPPPALLDRLERRLPLLVGGPHDLPDRQKTMRDAIDWSYQLLTDPQQRLFRTLSVFAGGCSLAAAATISGDHSTVDRMAELVDTNLVLATPSGRLAMLETIREYGLECLHNAGDADSVARRHAEYFLTYAEAAEPVEPELDNLRASLHWALDTEDAETALRLCRALWRHWYERGHIVEGLRWMRRTLALPVNDDVAAAIRIDVLVGAARLGIDQSAFDEAATWCSQAVAVAQRDGNEHDLVAALIVRGSLARVLDQYADALADHEEACAVARAGADRAGYAQALINLSYDLFYTGDSQRAESLAEQGLALTREIGDRRELAEALNALCRQLSHAGKFDRAEALGTEAVEMFRELRDTGRVADVLRSLGANAALQNEFARSDALFEECHAIYLERGDEHIASQILAHLGHNALMTGNLPRSRALSGQALTESRRFDDQWPIAMSTTQMGHVELVAGDTDRAHALFSEAARVFQAIGNPLYLSWCLEGLAGVAAAHRRFALAAQLCAARDAHLETIGAGLPPMNPDGYRGILATLQAELGPDGPAADRTLPEVIADAIKT